ncbi:hypothetical protein KVV02_006472 [Mortierella alpina]|uniref:Small ribosomal subunit protein uS17 N-terminal domain-containing protein n=1 Tax=Mortierella alpina TaxID=64518 RepID=A0A9P8D245_MORAP|nr:hypothetical protein KVV02_006472 [Mortierella alpina]
MTSSSSDRNPRSPASSTRQSSKTSSSRHRSSSVTSERSHRRMNKSNGPSSVSARDSIQRRGPSAKTTPMHDDTDAGRLIPAVRPALAIDYLGSSWSNEDDIAASWKLKDSDTTWLYGPLYKACIDEFDLVRFGAHTVPGGTKVPSTPCEGGLKPALKHKTASELFKADTLFHVQSDLKLDRKIEPKSKARETAVIKQHRQPKLRFNDSVEQCVSIDTDALSEAELDEEEEEDAGILMRISERRPARSIVRIHPTKLKAENMYGMEPEDANVDDQSYLGSPYTGTGRGVGYERSPHCADVDVDFDNDDDPVIAEIEKAFQKQQGIFQNAKVAGKKAVKNNRWYKEVGLGFKTPREAIEGHYIDKKCPFTGDVSIRGRILTGEVISTKMKRTIVIRREYLHFISKYNRYEKRHKNLAAHLSPCFIGVQQGDSVTVGQCRPLSKTVRFNVLKVQKKVVKGAKNFAKF